MGIVRVTISGIYLAQRMQNVIHFDNTDGAASHTEIRDEVATYYVAPLRNVMNAGAAFTEIKVQRVYPSLDTPTVFTLVGQVGSLSGGGAPSFVCGLIRIKTATPGRHGHGRIYAWGVHGESLSNGIFQADAWAAWQTYVTNIQNRFKTGGTGTVLRMGVCPRASPGDFIQMTSLQIPQIFGVQRRRNIGVGA